ncbi:MAG: glycosyltransferase [Bacteroidota bacterium]
MENTDVLLIALADVSRDARTLNLARALCASGLRVTIHGAVSGALTEIEGADGLPLSIIPWKDPGGRAIMRWWSLNASVRRLSVRPRVVAGMDLFALASAREIARRHTVPLIYDMRELYFALGPLGGRGLRQHLLASHERRLLADVDRVIVSGELDADLARERFHLSRRPFVLLNTPPYRDVVESDLRRRCGIDDAVRLAIYQGVVHHGRGLLPTFRAMQLIPDLHLAIVGDGPAEAELRQAATTEGVADRVHWLGSVPYDRLHALTCGADVGVCLIEPLSLSYEYALPNKLFEYMMARIPSLVTDLPALRALLDQHPVGVMVDRRLRAADVADAFQVALTQPRRQQMIDACAAITQMSYETQSHRAVELVRELLA